MRQLKPNIFAVGAIDWNRPLFDELIPLPDGTSYNAYLIKGSEKTALLDTVEPQKFESLMSNLVELGVDHIDYIVSHHGEQDHSGSIPDMLTLFPEAMVVANPKNKQVLIDHLHIDEDKFIVVQDDETLSLGDKTLQFIYTPWVHWPETYCSYLQEDKILFTCDFFGSHLASSSLFVEEEIIVQEAAKRYYAEIMMPFRGPIKKNLARLDGLEIDMIAPSHGPVYDRPEIIVNAYKNWVSDEVKNEVVLPFVSMHQSTRLMVEHFIDALMQRNITVKPFDMCQADVGKLAIALVDAATLVIGSPTVLTQAHPLVAYGAILANVLRPKARFVSIIGSYGWGGRMVDQLTGLIGNLKAAMLEPVLSKGMARDERYRALDNLADLILSKHQEIGVA